MLGLRGGAVRKNLATHPRSTNIDIGGPGGCSPPEHKTCVQFRRGGIGFFPSHAGGDSAKGGNGDNGGDISDGV